MKKLTKQILSCMLLSTTMFSAVACGGGGGNANADKATLYVYSFTSVFGD